MLKNKPEFKKDICDLGQKLKKKEEKNQESISMFLVSNIPIKT